MRLRRLLWLVPLLALLAASGGAWWLLTTEAGLVWAWGRAAAALDGRLGAERVSGRLLGPLRVDGLRLEQDGTRLAVDRVELDWRPIWLLAGRLALHGVDARGVVLELAEDGEAAVPAALAAPFPLSVEGAVLRDLRLSRPSAGAFRIDELRLDGHWRGPRLLLAPLDIRGPWGEVRLDGRLATGPGWQSELAAQWALTVDPALAGLEGAPLAVAGEGRLTGSHAEPRLAARFGAPFAFTVAGTLAWQESPLRWQAEFDLAPVDLAAVRADWPALEVGGRGRLTGAGTAFSLELDGTAAQARAGRWHYRSRIDAAVAAADYRGRLDLAVRRDGLPPLEVSADFAGDRDGIELSALAGRWLDGAWDGAVRLDWRDGLEWRLRLGVADANPGRLDGRYTGRLGGAAESGGRWREGRLSAALPRLELRGEVAGRPLRLDAAARLDGGQAHIERLELRSGTARLDAAGGAGDRWSLRWQLSATELADLWPGLAGRLQLAGQVDGAGAAPRLRLDGEGRGVAWAGTVLARAGLHADVDLAAAAPWRLEAELDGVERDGLGLGAVRLRGHGSAAQHDIVLEALPAAGGRVRIEGHGGWAERRWSGALRRGEAELPRLGRWQAAPAELVWGAAGGALQPWCWRGQGEVCLAAAADGAPWQATGALAGVPLSLLEPWLPRSDLALSGDVGGVVVAEGAAGRLSGLTARFGVADGRLLYRLPDGAVESALRTLRLDADGDGAGLSARLQAEAEDGGNAALALALPGWLPGLELTPAQPVRGRLDLEADRLDWLTYLEPNLLRPAGRLRVHLLLGGSVGEPALSGELELSEGDVLLPAAGIHLTGLSLNGRSADGRTLTLSGSARSGPGQLAVSGVLASQRFGHWRAEVGLKGERFELVRLVQARALVSPDLQVVLEPGRVEVRGQLAVPQADINLPRLPTVVEVSPDEVILDAAEEEAALRRWRLLLDLRLVAGERVRLEGYGFSGRLAGAVTLRGETPGLTRAQGELNIHDGRYEAYGQNLVVERGRLLFVDSPPDNPGLDVRAVRPLPDPEQVVGVEVGGRLKDPRLRLFSVPVLEESETLAWLVLGRPLTATSRTEADALYRAAFALGGDRAARGIALQFGLDEVSLEQGRSGDEAAVVLGKYLSPRLYLQYAVGLWETANRLRLRYQLSSQWSLKMEQGGEQSGADLQYVIER